MTEVPKARTLLVPTDLHDKRPSWFKFVFELARDLNARLILLHVVDYVPMVMPVEIPTGYPMPQLDLVRESAEKKLANVAMTFAPLAVEPQVRIGVAADAIVDCADELGVDQIVMGSHSRSGLARVVLGSVAERVARHANCPVTIVPHTED